MNANGRNPSQHAVDPAEWNRIAVSKPFRNLLALKKVFIIPAFAFFLAYYFALPILVGFAPKLMTTRVVGTVTLAYLFALSQFVVGWGIAALYVKASAKFDLLTRNILANLDDRQGEK
jgi:uncharacterized membrane protein (DUF485 family)